MLLFRCFIVLLRYIASLQCCVGALLRRDVVAYAADCVNAADCAIVAPPQLCQHSCAVTVVPPQLRRHSCATTVALPQLRHHSYATARNCATTVPRYHSGVTVVALL